MPHFFATNNYNKEGLAPLPAQAPLVHIYVLLI